MYILARYVMLGSHVGSCVNEHKRPMSASMSLTLIRAEPMIIHSITQIDE